MASSCRFFVIFTPSKKVNLLVLIAAGLETRLWPDRFAINDFAAAREIISEGVVKVIQSGDIRLFVVFSPIKTNR